MILFKKLLNAANQYFERCDADTMTKIVFFLLNMYLLMFSVFWTERAHKIILKQINKNYYRRYYAKNCFFFLLDIFLLIFSVIRTKTAGKVKKAVQILNLHMTPKRNSIEVT